MKKITFSFLILSTLILASCSSELEELNSNSNIVNLNSGPFSSTNSGATQNIKAVPGSYIVVFKDDDTIDEDVESAKINKEHGGNLKNVYKHTIKGFSIDNLSDKALAAIKKNPKVLYVEQDQEVFAISTQSPTPSWGLDRVDQVSLPFNLAYNYTQTGAGVKAYIIDTGIKYDHTDFTGRVIKGIDVIDNTFKDGNGHGTHVAGTVGGTKYGIAKSVTLVEVRVLNSKGSGTTSGVIAGIDWVVNNHTTEPAVANMSLGGGVSTTLDAAVQKGVADGIVFCVAAGNSTADASTSSPARVPEAITVAASDNTDTFAYYSNFGPLVDIIAPGTNITSDWNTSTTAINTISGTSMATPHVTGVAALYLSKYPGTSPANVQTNLKSMATLNKITKVPSGTANALLFSGL